MLVLCSCVCRCGHELDDHRTVLLNETIVIKVDLQEFAKGLWEHWRFIAWETECLLIMKYTRGCS